MKNFRYLTIVLITYLTFFGLWSFAAYETCGKEIFRMSQMEVVKGVLLSANRVGSPMNRSNADVRVEYSFIFNGKRITGNQIATCTSFLGASSTMDPYAEYYLAVKGRINEYLNIWIDPNSPETNYLFKHVPRGWLYIFGLTLIFGCAVCHSILRFAFTSLGFKKYI
jgi:hypothetical protein